MKTLARLLISILIFSSPSYADKINVFEFTEVELLELEVRKVKKEVEQECWQFRDKQEAENRSV